MTKREQLLQKAKNHRNGLSFDEFQILMKHHGWVLDPQTGSHQIWYSPNAYRSSVQNRNGKAKGYQVKQFLIQLAEETNDA